MPAGQPEPSRPHGPTGEFTCRRCGAAWGNVPLPLIKLQQYQHERSAHPEAWRRRQELQQALAQLDQELWGPGSRENTKNSPP